MKMKNAPFDTQQVQDNVYLRDNIFLLTLAHGCHTNYHQATRDLPSLLLCAEGASVTSTKIQHKPSCLDGTRVEILKEIETWADDVHDERTVFWLSGMAGTGKSTIARTVARDHVEKDLLCASFFFSRGDGDVGNARKFVRTIAYQLARKDSDLRRTLVDAVENTSKDEGLRTQWELFVLRPLATVKSRVFLVIDALDECESKDAVDVRLILQLLASAKSHMGPAKLRVLLTSRPETPIQLGFDEHPGIWHGRLVLNDVPREIVDHDITLYLRKELRGISAINEGILQLLVAKACGLFIWADTACRFIKLYKPLTTFARKQLEHILAEGTGNKNPEKQLDKIYTTILLKSIMELFEDKEDEDDESDDEERETLFSLFRQVVGSIVILFDPLSIAAIGSLIQLKDRSEEEAREEIEGLLCHLQSVLKVPVNRVDPVRILHPSFRDFLLTKERCRETQLRVEAKEAHRTLMCSCLGLMNRCLKKDICGVRAPGILSAALTTTQVGRYLSAELQYACLYWVQHLQESDFSLQDRDEVHQFLRLHLLHWLEALAWLGRTSEAILALISLEGQIQVEKSPRLHEVVRDAKRFAVYNRRIIEEAPLQLYCAALIFAPEKSIMRTEFHPDIPGWVNTKPRVQPNWSASLQTLEGHSGCVFSVALSRDGRTVASASDDGTVRLWNAATGAPLHTLEGHPGSVRSVAFSPDGRTVVSASDDGTVRVWDAAMGAPLQKLEGHPGRVRLVDFSRDGRSVVSASDDGTVRVWDAATGAPLQTLKGRPCSSRLVVFSPDRKFVASSSDDEIVRLFDVATGKPLQSLKGHSGRVGSVAFSPDGRLVVSGSDDETVRLWDAATGAPLQMFEGHSGPLWSVAFSADGKLVVSGADDDTVRLWDASTRAPLQALENHSGPVLAVAFSPDGRLVVSCSSDKTVRLWDAATGAPLETLERHSAPVASVAFSLDGRLVVSGSNDGRVWLWKVVMGAALQTLEHHSGRVNSVAFSPDGRSVVSASDDGTVRIWNAATGLSLQTLEGHSSYVWSAAFSQDGLSVVSGSNDGTVRLWNAATGEALQTLEGHSNAVWSAAFSPDGMSVVSGSSDKTVRLWATATGAPLQTLKGHSAPVLSVYFSPDGRSVISESDDDVVRLWDAATCKPLQTLEGRFGDVHTVAFSPDGKVVDSVFLSGNWIKQGEEKIVWLHPDYRGDQMGTHKGTVVIAQPFGKVLIMRFKSGRKVVEERGAHDDCIWSERRWDGVRWSDTVKQWR